MEANSTHIQTEKYFRLEPGEQFFPLRRKYSLSEPQNSENKKDEARDAELRKAAEGFEAIFIRQFLKSLRATLPGGGLFGTGAEGEIYADMMDNAIAETASKRGAFGIADIIYRQLVRDVPSETTDEQENTIDKHVD